MKGRTIILFATLSLSLVLVLTGCGLLSMSIEKRITQFVGALNAADRSQVYLNFSSADTQDYNTIKSAAYWDTPFPAGGAGDPQYSITSAIDESNPFAVYVTISGPPTFGGPTNYMFVMLNESVGMANWVIHELWIWDGISSFIVLIK